MNTGESIERLLYDGGWSTAGILTIGGRDAKRSRLDPAVVSQKTYTLSEKMYPEGVYTHQKVAVEQFARGENVCLATGTASGKTLLFHLAAVEVLANDPAATILCVYPMKALASEQEDRWKRFLFPLTGQAVVGRIAGDVSTSVRPAIFRRCRVLIVTPDVLHAWILPHCGDAPVRSFLKKLRLIVIDEAHSYTGVFGSNSAFLFRRLRHLCGLTGRKLRFVAASATLAKPSEHLANLVGTDFSVIGEDQNGASRFPINIRLVNPPSTEDFMTCLPKLIMTLAENDRKVIAFLDSRKQVELVSSIATRGQLTAGRDNTLSHDDDSDDMPASYLTEGSVDFLKKLRVLPYRSGYEEHDRSLIQRRLQSGDLNGVVSTSALELGIDVPHLDTGVLVGVPPSATSLHQRIGRVGRHKNGEIIILNTGSVYDESMFAEPGSLLSRPPAQGMLYLENRRLQYIHALCLARLSGEHDTMVHASVEEADFNSDVEFPHGFIELCRRERTGQLDYELQAMKGEAGDTPAYTFPLRDVETQFQITQKQGPEMNSLGRLSYSQVLREAYPGAIYRYMTRTYRVYEVGLRTREIKVRQERSYVTKPISLPTLVFPNLTGGNVYREMEGGELQFIEANLQIRESICGFSERRGMNESKYPYPLLSSAANLHFPSSTFFRNYFTSGLVLFHPALDREGVNRDLIRTLLYEAFFLAMPFERSDISTASDKLRTEWRQLQKGRRFISLHDSTYGSLRIAGRLLEPDIVRSALAFLQEIAPAQSAEQNTLAAIRELASCRHLELGVPSAACMPSELPADENYVSVVAPGSVALQLASSHERIEIVKVYWNAKEGQLYYKGIREAEMHEQTYVLMPVTGAVPVPGESVMKRYNLETGDIVD